jgi:hypothetical protein
MNPAAIFPMTGPRVFLIANDAAEAGNVEATRESAGNWRQGLRGALAGRESIFEVGKSAE